MGIIIDLLLWIGLVVTTITFIFNITGIFPKIMDIDPTDPLSLLDITDKEVEKVDCDVCGREKGCEPLIVCQDEMCVNNNDKH